MLSNVDEIVYPTLMDADALIKLIDTLDIAALNARTTELLKGHANPYTFTKHLAEHEIKNAGLPAAIVRPSMSESLYIFIWASIIFAVILCVYLCTLCIMISLDHYIEFIDILIYIHFSDILNLIIL